MTKIHSDTKARKILLNYFILYRGTNMQMEKHL